MSINYLSIPSKMIMVSHVHAPTMKKTKLIGNSNRTNAYFELGKIGIEFYFYNPLANHNSFFSHTRIAKAGPRSEPTNYEMIEFKGSFRRADLAPRGVRSNNYPTSLQMIRRTRCGRDDSFPSHTIGGNDIVSITTHFGSAIYSIIKLTWTIVAIHFRFWLQWAILWSRQRSTA